MPGPVRHHPHRFCREPKPAMKPTFRIPSARSGRPARGAPALLSKLSSALSSTLSSALSSALLPTLLATLALPATAVEYVTSDRTIANGNPISGNYIGQTVVVGASLIANGNVTRAPNVQVDVVAPALFSFNDQTGGGIAAYSNSVVRIQGGTFNQISGTGFGGGVSASDTSNVTVNGGALRAMALAGSAAGAAGARATINGGLIENGVAIAAYVVNGSLDVNGGTVRATGGQPGISGGNGSLVAVNGGLVQSALGAAIYMGDGALTMTGGTVTGGAGGGAQWGVRIDYSNLTATLRGGTVNGGVRADAASNQTALQATLGGSLTVNGGVFVYGNGEVDVTGGSYTRFAAADAAFFAMGSNDINFYGAGLALSGPTAGSVFETNHYNGNFYTFTAGTFADGQSAVGLRLFDATSVANNPLNGGFTLNAVSAVPEPATGLMLLLALPALGAAVRRRQAV